MKTVSFLCLMFVLVCSAPTSKNKPKIEHLLLEEIITEANRTYIEKFMNQFVQELPILQQCNNTSLCLAGKILSHIKSEDFGVMNWKLPQSLKKYGGLTTNTTCHVPHRKDQYELRALLRQVRDCAMKLYRTNYSHYKS